MRLDDQQLAAFERDGYCNLGPIFTSDFYFASELPTRPTAWGSSLGIQFLIEGDGGKGQFAVGVGDLDGDGVGNVQVNPGGSVTNTVIVMEDVIDFSVDGGVDTSGGGTSTGFDDADDTLNVYHMRVVGRMKGTDSTFDIFLSDAGGEEFTQSVTGLDMWAVDPALTNPASIEMKVVSYIFNNPDRNGSFVIDRIQFGIVPEPSSLLLAALVSFAALRRRRG